MDLPSKVTAETIQALVTSLGIVLTGAWAFWRWSLSEYLRQKREMPSFEGEMFARAVPHTEKQVVLTVSCKWRNMSAVPLNVNTQATKFTVFEVPNGTPLGPIGPRLGNLQERYVRKPWEHWPSAVLEPHTCSELQAHFLVEGNRPYVLACRLEADTKPNSSKQVWVRELVWISDQVTHDGEVAPNPSIERTAPGKPEAAAHVER
jgi:hypothetical protein